MEILIFGFKNYLIGDLEILLFINDSFWRGLC